MQGLLISELKHGHVYYCILAQRPVLARKSMFHGEDRWMALIYDKGYENIDIVDGMLTRYDARHNHAIKREKHKPIGNELPLINTHI